MQYPGSPCGALFYNLSSARIHGYDPWKVWQRLLRDSEDDEGRQRPHVASGKLQKTISSNLLGRALLPGYPFSTPLCMHPTIYCGKRWDTYFELTFDRGTVTEIERWMRAVKAAAPLLSPKVLC